MTEIYLHFLLAHYGLYGNAPVDHIGDVVAAAWAESDRGCCKGVVAEEAEESIARATVCFQIIRNLETMHD